MTLATSADPLPQLLVLLTATTGLVNPVSVLGLAHVFVSPCRKSSPALECFSFPSRTSRTPPCAQSREATGRRPRGDEVARC